MVEATFGILMLLFVALGAMQMVLVFHGALAAHSAAARTARTRAITGQQDQAQKTYDQQRQTALGALRWDAEPRCTMDNNWAQCTVQVHIPAIFPGGGFLFGSGGSFTDILVSETGNYPNFEGG